MTEVRHAAACGATFCSCFGWGPLFLMTVHYVSACTEMLIVFIMMCAPSPPSHGPPCTALEHASSIWSCCDCHSCSCLGGVFCGRAGASQDSQASTRQNRFLVPQLKNEEKVYPTEYAAVILGPMEAVASITRRGFLP